MEQKKSVVGTSLFFSPPWQFRRKVGPTVGSRMWCGGVVRWGLDTSIRRQLAAPHKKRNVTTATALSLEQQFHPPQPQQECLRRQQREHQQALSSNLLPFPTDVKVKMRRSLSVLYHNTGGQGSPSLSSQHNIAVNEFNAALRCSQAYLSGGCARRRAAALQRSSPNMTSSNRSLADAVASTKASPIAVGSTKGDAASRRKVHASVGWGSQGRWKAMTLAPLSTAEKHMYVLHAHLVQWIVFTAARLPSSLFQQNQSAIAAILLPTHHFASSSITNSLSPHDLYSKTATRNKIVSPSTLSPTSEHLGRQAAKLYVELLLHHRCRPSTPQEWQRLSQQLSKGTYSYPGDDFAACSAEPQWKESHVLGHVGEYVVLRIPLLPSSRRRRHHSNVNDAPRENSVLARQQATLHWREAVASLVWTRDSVLDQLSTRPPQPPAECVNPPSVTLLRSSATRLHISSADLLFIIRRVLQQSPTDDVGSTNATAVVTDDASTFLGVEEEDVETVLRHLCAWWHASRTAERREPGLASLCGIEKVECNTLRIKGRDATEEESSSELPNTTAYPQLLLSGKWQTVLAQIVSAATHEPQQGKERQALLKGGQAEALLRYFSHAGTAQRVPRKLPQRWWGAVGPLPQRLALDPVAQSELHLVQHPPSRGLDVLQEWGPAADPQSPSLLSFPHTIYRMAAKEIVDGRRPASPPSFVVELRRRLWLLQHLPRHLPVSLVCFLKHGVSSVVPQPFIYRSPALEHLPWFLLCILGEALDAASQPQSTLDEILAHVVRQARSLVNDCLFLSVPFDYAALQECVVSLLVNVGSRMLSSAIAAQRRKAKSTAAASFQVGQRIEEVFVATLDILLRPPPRTEYERHGVDQKADSDVGHNSTAESLGIATLHCTQSWSASAPEESVCYVSSALFVKLQRRVKSHRNYHASLYIEALSQTVPLRQLLLALQQETRDGDDGPPVLAPESAATVTTALLLHLLPHCTSSRSNSTHSVSLLLRKLGVPERLYFAAPAEKEHAVASYFKGVFHSSYISPVVSYQCLVDDAVPSTQISLSFGTSLEMWKSSAAARLVGRSLRSISPYPTTSIEPFFPEQLRHPCGKFTDGSDSDTLERLPPLMISLHVVDVASAISWCSRQRKSGVEQPMTWGSAPTIVASAAQLPYGLSAVEKPPLMTCTLHAHHGTLVFPFLTHEFPWQHRCNTSVLKKADDGFVPSADTSGIPVLHQQGLVNRIDVGTSGLILVARDALSLHLSCDATLTRHLVRKAYRVLVQRWPIDINDDMSCYSTFSTRLLCLSPMQGLVDQQVYAAGTTHAGVQQSEAPRHSSGVESQSLSPPLLAQATDLATTYTRPRVVDLDQRSAITHYRILQHFPSTGVYYVHVELCSGRRHQIRQHFAQLGYPLVGDSRYHGGVTTGVKGTCFGMKRPALHAYTLDILSDDVVANPESGAETYPDTLQQQQDSSVAVGRVVVQCELPYDIRDALRQLQRLEQDVSTGQIPTKKPEARYSQTMMEAKTEGGSEPPSASISRLQYSLEMACAAKASGNALLQQGNPRGAVFLYKKACLHLTEFLPVSVTATPFTGVSSSSSGNSDEGTSNSLVHFLQRRQGKGQRVDQQKYSNTVVDAEVAAVKREITGLYATILNNLSLAYLKLERYREGVACATALLSQPVLRAALLRDSKQKSIDEDQNGESCPGGPVDYENYRVAVASPLGRALLRCATCHFHLSNWTAAQQHLELIAEYYMEAPDLDSGLVNLKAAIETHLRLESEKEKAMMRRMFT